MKKVFYFILLVAFMLSVAGCKKKDATKTKMDLITAHSWVTTAVTIDPSMPIVDNGNIIGYITDLWAQTPDCLKDDFRTYKSDLTVVSDEGANKCNPSDPQNTTGTWLFNSDQTIVTETIDGSTTSYDILQLDDNTYIVKVIENIGGTNYTLTVTNVPK